MNERNDGGEALAPIIPIFGRTSSTKEAGDEQAGTPSSRHPAARAVRLSRSIADIAPTAATEDDTESGDAEALDADSHDTAAIDADQAHAVLVKKLRGRQLSVSEATRVLNDLGAAQTTIEEVIVDFIERRYLDDYGLARTLVAAGIERKHQGRRALAQTLKQRGLSHEVIDEVLEETGDDEAARALQYAQEKARSLSRYDDEVALRRLVGQLARRGYSGGIAVSAAKQALAHNAASGGVRFEPS
ncbi:regulatory protein RecX [Microbacterium sp. YY-01]|uniref:regulatory protein RecX n=1 Tax=Microbacterium sp. YY-01 TaxID=3421634 RepID=UPI003D171F8C